MTEARGCEQLALTIGMEKYGTSVYATWFTAGGAIHIAHYDVINDVITGKL